MEIRRYDRKIAVVTGAANGIGRSMVKRLVEEGAKVAALDIDMEAMEKEYEGQEDIFPVFCDVSEKNSVDGAVAKVLEHFGRIDVLFSNAGIIGRQSLLDTTEESWRKVIDINLNGMFFVNQAVLRSMVEKKIKGSVVNTSSIASATVSTNTGAYSASKGGVTQFTKWAALEMAPHGIRVNAIGPGTSVTRITEGTRFNPERNEKFLRNIPMGRYGEPEEAAAAALYLGSEDASYITGVTLLEDGGFSLF
ncbi:SDR family oxidoreductase [Enterocloster citroniae]|uniref:SDR family NAD(P)-dependent oxidoreductase n=1 Tax=Enterocloster citroniae TaxID=358743 RepID=UPI001D0898D5|nr:SDR family oxidoreductase [Enterocloster citroniae]MCB7063460.1 SDR family oxidoreductase [Enterocloster citroniae]